ncbi:SH3 domain-containing protein [Cantharellus anzutake]|uniref:SH3 domain-containing protein n=1 Tax=Cantharellus anzutake TaxID=1750568 RepID=UPI00190544E5|nr:SH3 domain-containing protein [Cantharellus anzutake]KAF8339563.1 SH3 domain-containing protein [Cantharellus anzutake]
MRIRSREKTFKIAMGASTNADAFDFLVEQIKTNVKFLQTKGRLSSDAARQVENLLDTGNTSTPFPSEKATPFTPTIAPAPAPSPAPQVRRVRALYHYDNPGDLCFKAGDIVELTPRPDDNDDWWTGSLNGQTGLFPSNYVEKMQANDSSPPPPSGVYSSTLVQTTYTYSEKPGPPQPVHAPPYQASGPTYNPPPGPSSTTVVVQQPDGAPGKKSKFGRLGSTMANSAAGGVGFGAGAAVGSGIINAIF